MKENRKKERDNLNPLEEAEHFRECQEQYKMTVRKIGKKYHVSKSEIDRKIAILSLPGTIQRFLSPRGDNFQIRHAYELTKNCKPDKLKKVFIDNALFLEDWEAQYQIERYSLEMVMRKEVKETYSQNPLNINGKKEELS